MQGCVRWAAFAIVLLTACSMGDPQPSAPPSGSPSSADHVPIAHVPTLPATAMHGYVTRLTPIDAAGLAGEALNAPALASVLAGAGFEGGVERRFTARARALTEVVARVLKFGTPEGATAYVAWFASHGTDLLGSRAQPADPPDVPGAVAFRHGVSGCCTKDTFQYIAAWTRGPYAMTLLVGGPDAGHGSASPLAAELDARVRKDG